MELRKKLYTPAWRDPRVLRAEARDKRARPVMAALTVACILCLLLPDRWDYSKAISLQLSEGGTSARLLFGLMFVTIAYFAVRLWVWGSRAASASSVMILGALGVIALTNPFSAIHNGAFVALSIALCSGHVGLFYKDADGKLFFTAAGALGGMGLCIFNLGMGERMLIGSSCLAVLLLYYGELDP